MPTDEVAIREVIATWIRATAVGDVEQLLGLMTDDVVFLTPGQKPFGKDAFAATFRASLGKVRIQATSTVQEIQLAGDLASCWNHLDVTVTPTQGGDPKRLAGYTLTVLRKQPDGRWLLARDANLLVAAPVQRSVQAVVPVFHVVSVASSVVWYREVLGFAADPFGPADDPSFAILCRDGAELMLQKISADPARAQTAEESWDAYIRVADVHGFREAVRAHLPDVAPVVRKEYECQEFEVTDLDGHRLVFGQCGGNDA